MFKRKERYFLKLGVLILAAGSLFTGKVSAAEVMKVNHIYIKDQFIGSVQDEEEMKKALHEKLEAAKEDYPNLTFTEDEQVSQVEEIVFHSKTEDEKTIEKLKDSLEVKASAYDIMLDGKPVVTVASKEDAEEVMKEIKLQFMTDNELEAFEKFQDADQKDKKEPLTEPGSRIVDIHYSVPVGMEEISADPEDVLAVKDAVKFIEEGQREPSVHIAKKGENLEAIAEAYEMSLKEAKELNPKLEKKELQKGDKVHVMKTTPYVSVIVEKVKLKEKEIPYKKEVIKDKEMLKGETSIEQQGETGTEQSAYSVIETNGEISLETMESKEVTKKPVKEKIKEGTKVIPSQGSGSFIWPADGGYISSKQGQRWGKLHKGIDIARPTTKTIKAADHGTIEFAGAAGGYGNKVMIDHHNGYKTVYAHLNSIAVKQGQKVEKGTVIGQMGTTGHSTGIHLHFEVYKNGTLANPLDYIAK
ncbi:peptidoglycan DD-metalloendopeptidase family protein [Bacillus massiliglaciei]|uniref:peptidoglycan DD-metalloendopeptidase family protein n=1 Tax=Bacillus massiliglaciei TaxID=1816693 RepID=UPI000A66B747|nr:M23 family metallopeptidase [Bacillus massiliglaciei]